MRIPPMLRGAAIVIVGVLLAGSGWALAAGRAGWHILRIAPTRASYGPPTCWMSTDCWVPSGSSVVVTHTGGISWKVWSAEPGQQLSSVSCTDSLICWATVNSNRYGRAARHPIIGSTDGGRTWHAVTVSGHVTQLDYISCATSEFCVAVGGAKFSPRIPLLSQLAVVSTDGGRTWRVIPHLDYHRGNNYSDTHMYADSCPAAGVCFAAGLHGQCTPHGCAGNTGTVIATFDAGRHWRFQAIPRGSDLLWDISCVSRTHCWAVGRTGETSSDHGVIVATSDSGAHWRSQTPPPGTLTMDGISCSDARHCTSIGFRHDLSSVIVTTSDGGRHWLSQAPPAGATLEGILWCWSAGHCLAPATYRYGHGPWELAAS